MGLFVSVGDSVARGVGDERDGGWVRRLTELLEPAFGPLELANLAERDARAPRVRITQLPAAVQRPAEIAAVVVGMNDALGAFWADNFRRDFAEILAGLSGVARHVLTTTLVDVSGRIGLAEPERTRVAEQIRQANEVIAEVSAKQGALCLRAPADGPDCGQMWSADGLHPGPGGHAWMARGFAELLGAVPPAGESAGDERGGPSGERSGDLPSGQLGDQLGDPSGDLSGEDSVGRADEVPPWFRELARDPRAEVIAPALAADVELRTPARAEPFTGRAAVARVLAAFLGEVVAGMRHHGCYARGDSLCMTFSGSVSGVPCEGVDLLEIGPDGLVHDCAVFLRPMHAVVAMSREMGALLEPELLGGTARG